MAKNKGKNKKQNRKKKDIEEELENEDTGMSFNVFRHLEAETARSIWAILMFVLALFLVLASGAISKAGIAGEYTYAGLHYLLGIGYYLVPLILFVISILILIPSEKKARLGIPNAIAGVIFVISGLGIIELVSKESGGVIGGGLVSVSIPLFDTYMTAAIFIALIIIALLVIFNTTLKLNLATHFAELVMGKKKKAEEGEEGYVTNEGDGEYAYDEPEAEEEDYDDEAEEEEYDEPAEQPKKARKGGASDTTDASPEDELDITASGKGTFKPYKPPPLKLLENDKGKPGVGDIKANANIIKRTLSNFGVTVEMDEISIGPTVTRYALKPAEGVKLSRIVGLQNDLSLALAAHPIRIEAPIPGKSQVGIEIPNQTKTMIGLGTMLTSNEAKKSDKELLIALGKGIAGATYFADLGKMPHLLISGSTGSGKSVLVHSIVTSLLFRNSPESMKFIMIDPKRVELTLYKKIPHLLTPVITDPKKAILALKWATKEMDRRYNILENEQVRDISSYHKNVLAPALKKEKKSKSKQEEDEDSEQEQVDRMPYIVVIIDELADIMQAYPRELESAIVRLAQMSRAVGIHLILSTQRPSVNVITGLIKANIPARIALQVSSQIDSRTILDTGGAEKLLGAGDMLYLSGEMAKPQRIQSCYISENEVKNVVKYLSENYDVEDYENIEIADAGGGTSGGGEFGDEEEEDDPLYEEARETVIRSKKASTSFLQRKLRIGYGRAARLVDMLEERGVIAPSQGSSKPREVLIEEPSDEYPEDDEGGGYDAGDENADSR